jgi:hypothetical protein
MSITAPAICKINQPEHYDSVVRQAVACLLILGTPGISSAAQSLATTPEKVSRSPVQSIYRHGVPHTDRTGAIRHTYDSSASFLTIGAWGIPHDDKAPGREWAELKSANFNTAWPWGNDTILSLKNGESNDMQIVLSGEPTEAELRQVRDTKAYRDRLLGIVWKDEPSISRSIDKMQSDLSLLEAYRRKVQAILPHTPVFVNEPPAFVNGPDEAAWWKKWTIAGDLSAQDNYPIYSLTTSIGLNPGGMTESISRAVHTVNQQKPVWAVIQAFESNTPQNKPWAWRFPSPVQMRAMVYGAFIHGATGIVYFSWDTAILREPDLIGISPHALPSGYKPPGSKAFQASASSEQIRKSADLWKEVASINLELQELAPTILSPTIDPAELTCEPQITNLSAPNDPKKYSDTPLRTLLKRAPDGRYVVLAVNVDNRSMDVSFTSSKRFSEVSVLHEHGPPAVSHQKGTSQFQCHFGPFATHAFRLSTSEQ